MSRRIRVLVLMVLFVSIVLQLPMRIAQSQLVDTYYPSGYNLLGSTAYVSGALVDLQSDNGAYMSFRSFDTSTVSRPIANMNFTADSLGWVYSEVDAKGYASDGGWQSSGGNTLGSGGGNHRVIYNDNDNKQPASSVTDIVRITYAFTTPSEAWDSQGASFAWKYSLDSGSYTTQTLTVRAKLLNATDYVLETLYSTSTMQTSWQYVTNLAIAASLQTSTAYKLQLEFSILNGGAGNKANIFQVSIYWDDAGVRFEKLQQTIEVEFTGVANNYTWTQLVWTVDSAWTAPSVSVTLQLYNYALSAYSTSGDGYIAYTSSATANTDETQSQTITTSANDFHDAAGNWKLKVKGVKSIGTQFDFNADLVKSKVIYVGHNIVVVNVTASPTTVLVGGSVTVNVTVKNEGFVSESFDVNATYDNTLIGTQPVTNLAAGASITATFLWNTTGVALGTYTIKGAASQVSGETKIDDNVKVDGTVKVVKPPVAAFTYSPSKPLVGEVVTFDASASTPDGGTIVSYRWDFGDINVTTVSDSTITHVYSTYGTYNVNLTVTDSDGLSDSDWKLVKIYIGPTADFSYSPIPPIVNEAVTFNASASSDPDGSVASYRWDFDDGNVTTVYTSTIVHVFTAPATYSVNLTVTDNDGFTDSIVKFVSLGQFPTADFTWTPLNPLAGALATFNASASTPNGGTIVSYRWDFGDGNVTTVADPIILHSYAAYGTYSVNLTVTDSEGLSDSVTKPVTVIAYPKASFVFSPTTPLAGESVTFNASASIPEGGTIVDYKWDFGDGNVTTTASPTIVHVYTVFGNYLVNLTVTDSESLSDSITKSITVIDYPTANFTYLPALPLVGELITFDASGSAPNGGTIVSYEWNFGDGNITTETISTITHAYTNVGTYTVSLNVTDSEGLSHSLSKMVTVYVHDVAVVDVVVTYPYSASWAYAGWSVNITVLVRNSGNFTEDFTVAVYGNRTVTESILVGNKSVAGLGPGSETWLTFTWDTSGLLYGNYTIKAESSIVPNEYNVANNVLFKGVVKLGFPGDATGDGFVDGSDLGILAGSWFQTYPNPAYDWHADFNGDGIVDGSDLGILAANWFKGIP